MGNQKHIVNKQVLEIKLYDKKDTPLIQDALSKAYWNYIFPVIERVADRFTNDSEIIRLDKLEIDVGGISIDKLDTDFPQKVEKILEEVFIRKIHERENNIINSDDYDVSKGVEKPIVVKTDLANNLEIFNHFLLTGTMPWWSSKEYGATIQIIANNLLDKSPDKLKKILLELLINQTIRKRFIYQFTEDTIIRSLYILIPTATKSLLEQIERLIEVQAINPFVSLPIKTFREIVWDSILMDVVENSNPSQIIELELIHNIFSRLIIFTSNEPLKPKGLFNLISKTAASIRITKQQVQELAKLNSSIKILLSKYKTSEDSDNSIYNTPANVQSDEKTQLEIFAYFLQTGNLQNENGNLVDLSIQQIVEELLEKSPRKLRLFLLDQLIDISARKRFIYQLSDNLIKKIIQLLLPSAKSSIVENIEQLITIQSKYQFINITEILFREHIWNSTLAYIIKNSSNVSTIDEKEAILWIVNDLLYLVENKHIHQADILETLSNIAISINNIKNNQTTFIEIESIIKLIVDDINKSGVPEIIRNRSINILEEQEYSEIEKDINISKENHIREKETELYRSYNSLINIESEHIYNAGLALLWPFLIMFFVRLNLVKDRKFISNEAAQRAVHLLQYLITEQEETPENELIFNKLLCGINIVNPIPLGFIITDNEKEECNALLQSVIDNWTVLKNSSLQALRTTFLQKEGILSKQANGWKLYIERTSVDVLLDRLPWSISMIVLPWSNEIIYVEW